MNKLFFFLLLVSMFLFNCTKNEVTTSELSLEEPFKYQFQTSDSDVISRIGPALCKYPTLKIEDYGADGSSYYRAIEDQLEKYASCLSKSNNEECTIGYAGGSTVSFELRLCRSQNYALCTDENGEVTSTYINPETFNVEQYIRSKLNKIDECGQGCVAIANGLSINTDYLLCDCGAPTNNNDIPCQNIPFEAKKNTSISINVSYYCCCLSDDGGAF